MLDYKTIDLSNASDTKKDIQLEKWLAEFSVFPPDKNKDLVEIYKEWILDAQLEQCARTNNVQRALELIEQTPAENVTDCLAQAAARGHVEVLTVFAQHTATCLNRVWGLEAAAYFNHKDCVDLMLPHCVTSADQWMVKKGLEAAIEGKNFELAHILMPYVDVTAVHSAPFRYAVHKGQQEVAELFYPYSDIPKMLKYIKSGEEPEELRDMVLQWIEEYENKQLAQRINDEVNASTARKTLKKI